MRNKSNIKKCVVCGKDFECYPKAKTNHCNGKVKRLPKSVTCSNACSKKYRYMGWKIRDNKKKTSQMKAKRKNFNLKEIDDGRRT